MKKGVYRLVRLFALMLLTALILGTMTGCYDFNRDSASDGTIVSVENEQTFSPKHPVEGNFYVTYKFRGEGIDPRGVRGTLFVCFYDETGEELLFSTAANGDIDGQNMTVRIARKNSRKIICNFFGYNEQTIYLRDTNIDKMQICLRTTDNILHDLTYQRGGNTFLGLGFGVFLSDLFKVVLIYGVGALMLIFAEFFLHDYLPSTHGKSALSMIGSTIFGVSLFLLLALLDIPVIQWLNRGADLLTAFNLPDIPQTGWIRIVLWIGSVSGIASVLFITWVSCQKGFHHKILPCLLLSSTLHAIYFYMIVVLVVSALLAALPLILMCFIIGAANESDTTPPKEPSKFKTITRLSSNEILAQDQYGNTLKLVKSDNFCDDYYGSDGKTYKLYDLE